MVPKQQKENQKKKKQTNKNDKMETKSMATIRGKAEGKWSERACIGHDRDCDHTLSVCVCLRAVHKLSVSHYQIWSFNCTAHTAIQCITYSRDPVFLSIFFSFFQFICDGNLWSARARTRAPQSANSKMFNTIIYYFIIMYLYTRSTKATRLTLINEFRVEFSLSFSFGFYF